jgi:Rha family phage regulatory protein
MNDLSEFVTLHHSTLTTDTRRIAKYFKKRHDNVLRAFDNLECSKEFSRLDFELREYVDIRGKAQRDVRMTKDGFMFMVIGFSGKESARIV